MVYVFLIILFGLLLLLLYNYAVQYIMIEIMVDWINNKCPEKPKEEDLWASREAVRVALLRKLSLK